MSNAQRALIEAAQAGDRQAFARLVDTEYAVIYRFALKWCGVVEDAEDIAQQACIKLAASLGQFRFESAFHTWLYRLVINCAKDWQQSQRRHESNRVSDPQDTLINARPAPGTVETSVFLQAVLAWVAGLGEGFKEAVLLVLGEGLTHQEAARILDVKESTVSWRIHEVRKRIGQWQEQSGSGP
ncbi:RNA polymerase sigma factor [Simiduia sp. 21SJ11W-1]|uniref:RNA polymerase sigma factor n=1 Tax=Simiduia sp. 21SJ11W-1 TaxID=2909669 RepID=UPI0020A14F7F|nr:RNA polymerase sigma factor [Simiduia sp. 21SJ11W-1]UTA47675.1 RNA polymerase sigma factor [Simiduia sp. 21SJ11W-1]